MSVIDSRQFHILLFLVSALSPFLTLSLVVTDIISLANDNTSVRIQPSRESLTSVRIQPSKESLQNTVWRLAGRVAKAAVLKCSSHRVLVSGADGERGCPANVV